MLGFRRSKPEGEASAPDVRARQIGCFGKLPIQPEYIKHNAAHREVRSLDQWLQAGVALTARNHAVAGAPVGWLHHGVFSGSDDDRPLLFTVAPSRDRSDRRYPFVVFELPGARERDTSPGYLPVCAEAFFDGAHNVMAQPWRNEPLETVLAWVDGIGEIPRMPGRGGLGDLGAERLLDQLYRDVTAPRRMAHLKRTVELFRQVERRTAPRVQWGVRLPLAAEARAMSIGLWLRLADSVLGRHAWRPCYLWQAEPTADASGDLLLFFRVPPAQVVTYVLEQRGLHDTVVDPFDEVDGADEDGELPPGITTVQSLLDMLTQGSRA